MSGKVRWSLMSEYTGLKTVNCAGMLITMMSSLMFRPLRLSPAESADPLDVAYGGQTGAFTVLLGFAWYPYEPSGKLMEDSRALACLVWGRRRPRETA